MVHEAGLEDKVGLMNTAIFTIAQGVRRVVYIPVSLDQQPLAFMQHPAEPTGSVYTYTVARRTDMEGMSGILLDLSSSEFGGLE